MGESSMCLCTSYVNIWQDFLFSNFCFCWFFFDRIKLYISEINEIFRISFWKSIRKNRINDTGFGHWNRQFVHELMHEIHTYTHDYDLVDRWIFPIQKSNQSPLPPIPIRLKDLCRFMCISTDSIWSYLFSYHVHLSWQIFSIHSALSFQNILIL